MQLKGFSVMIKRFSVISLVWVLKGLVWALKGLVWALNRDVLKAKVGGVLSCSALLEIIRCIQ